MDFVILNKTTIIACYARCVKGRFLQLHGMSPLPDRSHKKNPLGYFTGAIASDNRDYVILLSDQIRPFFRRGGFAIGSRFTLIGCRGKIENFLLNIYWTVKSQSQSYCV